jgi:hypothetical protein
VSEVSQVQNGESENIRLNTMKDGKRVGRYWVCFCCFVSFLERKGNKGGTGDRSPGMGNRPSQEPEKQIS